MDLLEQTYLAYFTNKESKAKKITQSILILDTLKFFISVAWEAKLISHKQFEQIAIKLDEIGRMLGGWKNSLNNPNSHVPHL